MPPLGPMPSQPSLIADSAQPGPWLLAAQADGRLLRLSPDFEGLTGWHPSALLGAPWTRLLCPEDRAAAQAACQASLLRGETRLTARLLRPDGAESPAQLSLRFDHRQGQWRICLQLEGTPRELGRPSESGTRAERPPVTQALGGAGQGAGEGTTVMQALGAAGAAALEVAADGRIAAATQAVERVLGQDISQLRHLRIEEVFSMPRPAAAALAQARQRHQTQSVLVTSRAGQRPVVLEWLAGDLPGSGYALISSSQGDGAGMERLRTQSQLVSLVVHDVRDSLSAVHHGLQTLAEELALTDGAQETVGRMLRENERAVRIAQDVLLLSRPGSLDRVELDVDLVVLEAGERFRGKAEQRGVSLDLDLASGEQVLADVSALERALSNLIDNALDATPAEGQVTLRTRRERRGRDGVLIEVRDTGVGIAPEDLAQVFEPYVTHKRGGTGLGLAIARRAVLDHGGQIDVDSQPGQGSSFYCWLPALHD